MAQPVFNLPFVMLEKLFQLLPAPDRCRLGACCSRLSAVMDSPFVWSRLTVYLDADLDTENSRELSVTEKRQAAENLSARHWAIMEKYGQYVKVVNAVVNTAYLDDRSLDLLEKLRRKCLVKSLCLRMDVPLLWDYGGDMSHFHGEVAAQLKHQRVGVATLMRNILADTHVTVQLLPPHGPNNTNILQRYHNYCHQFLVTLVSSPCEPRVRLQVKKLILSATSPPEASLALIDKRVPTKPTVQLMSRFPNLQELHVSPFNLSDQLLVELAASPERERPLRRLVIRHERESGSFPCLSSEAWTQLTKASPSLEVECHVVVNPLHKLLAVIKPQTPLVKLTVSCHSADKQEELNLYQMCKIHSSTLQYFHLSLADSSRTVHKGLVDMVAACARLQHLLLNVPISDHLLLVLARDARQWRTFRFNPTLVQMHPEPNVLPPPGCEMPTPEKRLESMEACFQEMLGFSPNICEGGKVG